VEFSRSLQINPFSAVDRVHVHCGRNVHLNVNRAVEMSTWLISAEKRSNKVKGLKFLRILQA
jgi:hypothetical protein